MAQHTPGPWKVLYDQDEDGAIAYIGRETGQFHAPQHVARILGWGADYTGDAEQQANARLIAAAPDLFDALHDLSQTFDAMCALAKSSGPNFDALRAKVRAALARAEGR